MELKQCKSCLETKSISEFFKKADSKDGYRNYCKTCESKKRPKKGPQTTEQRKEAQAKAKEKKQASMLKFLSENPNHATIVGSKKRKAIIGISEDGKTVEFDSAVSAETAGFDRFAISKSIQNGWYHNGFKWSFKNEK